MKSLLTSLFPSVQADVLEKGTADTYKPLTYSSGALRPRTVDPSTAAQNLLQSTPFVIHVHLLLTAGALHPGVASSGFWVTIPKETYKRMVSKMSNSPHGYSWSQGHM